MRALAMLLALSACTYDAADDAIWSGTISRDGTPVAFAGYDPFPSQGFEFGASPATMGYIEDGDTKLLVQIILRFADDDFERDMPPLPFMLTIKTDFDTTTETGMGVDYLEQPASDNEVDFDVEPTYQVQFGDQTSSMTGSFTVTDTDYRTFLVGSLFAQVTNSAGSFRGLDFDVEWRGQK